VAEGGEETKGGPTLKCGTTVYRRRKTAGSIGKGYREKIGPGRKKSLTLGERTGRGNLGESQPQCGGRWPYVVNDRIKERAGRGRCGAKRDRVGTREKKGGGATDRKQYWTEKKGRASLGGVKTSQNK